MACIKVGLLQKSNILSLFGMLKFVDVLVIDCKPTNHLLDVL